MVPAFVGLAAIDSLLGGGGYGGVGSEWGSGVGEGSELVASGGVLLGEVAGRKEIVTRPREAGERAGCADGAR